MHKVYKFLVSLLYQIKLVTVTSQTQMNLSNMFNVVCLNVFELFFFFQVFPCYVFSKAFLLLNFTNRIMRMGKREAWLKS